MYTQIQSWNTKYDGMAGMTHKYDTKYDTKYDNHALFQMVVVI